jgi:tetratricopeptide (TPR) repeat protein
MSISPPLELMSRALELDTRRDVDGAISLLATGLEAPDYSQYRPDIAILAKDLAIRCETTGRRQLAIEYVRKGLAICPDDLGLLYSLADLLIATEQFDEGRQAFEIFSMACDSSTDPLRNSWSELRDVFRSQIRSMGS